MNQKALIPASLSDHSCVEHFSESPDLVRARRILVADDDECMRHIISIALNADGFEVNAAADGEQAWEALHHEHYDLLVTDNEMPRLAGMKLIQRIRNEGLSLPVIMASGTFSAESIRDDPQLQITEVLSKPFGPFKLLDTVRHALQSAGDSAAGHGNFHEPNPSLKRSVNTTTKIHNDEKPDLLNRRLSRIQTVLPFGSRNRANS